MHAGRKFFSNDIANILAIRATAVKKKVDLPEEMNKDRIQDVLYLLCHEFSNAQISKMLCLSTRTIEYYRKKISILINTKNTAGMIRYAIESGILDNQQLIDKWKKQIKKNTK